jgi:hypothetical protein
MFYNNVVILHNITSWCGKEVTNGSHWAVKCKRIVHVLMYEVQVGGETAAFNVTTLHVNGRIITEVYVCINFFLHMTMCCFRYVFLSHVLYHVNYSRKPLVCNIMLGFYDK